MPPVRFESRVNPYSRSSAIALALASRSCSGRPSARRIKLAEAVGQFGEGDDGRSRDPADRDLLGVADVEDEQRLAPIEPRFQFRRRDGVVDGGPTSAGLGSAAGTPQNCW